MSVEMNFHDIRKPDATQSVRSLKRGVSHRAMLVALAMPVMVLISPTGRSARAATINLGGAAVTFTNAQTGTLKAIGTGTRINITGTITTGQNAVIVNSGTVARTSGTGVLRTGAYTFAGTVSNKGLVSIVFSSQSANSATARGVSLTNVTSAVFKNAGTIKAIVSNTKASSANANATGVKIAASTSGDTVTFKNLTGGKITAKASVVGSSSSATVNAVARGVMLGGATKLVGSVSNAGTIKASATGNSLTAGIIAVAGISISQNVNTFTGNITNAGKICVKASGGSDGSNLVAVGIVNNATASAGHVLLAAR